MKKLFVILFTILTVVGTIIIAKNNNEVPKGWFFRAVDASLYEVGTDNTTSESGKACAYVISHNSTESEFGNLMQAIDAKNYLGKRLQLTAYIKSINVSRVQMWMRIDGKNPEYQHSLGFDNMGKRPITGTTDWKQYSIVLEVPDNAAAINYGFLIVGTGEFWVDNVKITEVNKTVPVTNIAFQYSLPSTPVNLNFEE